MASSAVPLREGPPCFTRCRPPPTKRSPGTWSRTHDRVTRLLRRGGRLPDEPSPTDPVAEQMPLLAGYAAASIQERIATGPPGRPSRAAAAHRRRGDGRAEAPVRPPGGVLAAGQCGPGGPAREQLEHLCRYLLRPPLALDRLTESSHGQLVYELPHPRRDGATHLLLPPGAHREALRTDSPAPVSPAPLPRRSGPPIHRSDQTRATLDIDSGLPGAGSGLSSGLRRRA